MSMQYDRGLSREECKVILRRLELQAYSMLITALRAQGDLTGDKKDVLDVTGVALSISAERHRAEIRRVMNDDRLNFIAESICGTTTSEEWSQEGRRLVQLLPRVVPQNSLVLRATNIANNTLAVQQAHSRSSSTDPGTKPMPNVKNETVSSVTSATTIASTTVKPLSSRATTMTNCCTPSASNTSGSRAGSARHSSSVNSVLKNLSTAYRHATAALKIPKGASPRTSAPLMATTSHRPVHRSPEKRCEIVRPPVSSELSSVLTPAGFTVPLTPLSPSRPAEPVPVPSEKLEPPKPAVVLPHPSPSKLVIGTLSSPTKGLLTAHARRTSQTSPTVHAGVQSVLRFSTPGTSSPTVGQSTKLVFTGPLRSLILGSSATTTATTSNPVTSPVPSLSASAAVSGSTPILVNKTVKFPLFIPQKVPQTSSFTPSCNIITTTTPSMHNSIASSSSSVADLNSLGLSALAIPFGSLESQNPSALSSFTLSSGSSVVSLADIAGLLGSLGAMASLGGSVVPLLLSTSESQSSCPTQTFAVPTSCTSTTSSSLSAPGMIISLPMVLNRGGDGTQMNRIVSQPQQQLQLASSLSSCTLPQVTKTAVESSTASKTPARSPMFTLPLHTLGTLTKGLSAVDGKSPVVEESSVAKVQPVATFNQVPARGTASSVSISVRPSVGVPVSLTVPSTKTTYSVSSSVSRAPVGNSSPIALGVIPGGAPPASVRTVTSHQTGVAGLSLPPRGNILNSPSTAKVLNHERTATGIISPGHPSASLPQNPTTLTSTKGSLGDVATPSAADRLTGNSSSASVTNQPAATPAGVHKKRAFMDDLNGNRWMASAFEIIQRLKQVIQQHQEAYVQLSSEGDVTSARDTNTTQLIVHLEALTADVTHKKCSSLEDFLVHLHNIRPSKWSSGDDLQTWDDTVLSVLKRHNLCTKPRDDASPAKKVK